MFSEKKITESKRSYKCAGGGAVNEYMCINFTNAPLYIEKKKVNMLNAIFEIMSLELEQNLFLVFIPHSFLLNMKQLLYTVFLLPFVS